MALLDALKADAQAAWDDTVATRRAIHQHPELAFEEHRTAALVAEQLAAAGLTEVQTGVAQTGVVATIRGQHPQRPAQGAPVIALRADMDALPIQETGAKPYISQVPGRMHACGHDVHTASLLTVARLLHHHRDALRGDVRLLFQPSEEKLPGGAKAMLEAGALDVPGLVGIVGQHVMPYLPVGTVGVRSGKYMASTDELHLTVRGQGGHGAQPHQTVDPVGMAAQLITALQQVVSRRADPRMPSVLTFGRVMADGATNIIPAEVQLAGTFRTFDEDWRNQAHELITRMAKGVVEGMGGEVDVNIVRGYPVLYNNPQLADLATNALADYLGAEQVQPLDLWMASEDFALYTQQHPGFFYRLGTANPSKPGTTSGLHKPDFDIDEDALQWAPGLMAYTAARTLDHYAQAAHQTPAQAPPRAA